MKSTVEITIRCEHGDGSKWANNVTLIADGGPADMASTADAIMQTIEQTATHYGIPMTGLLSLMIKLSEHDLGHFSAAADTVDKELHRQYAEGVLT